MLIRYTAEWLRDAGHEWYCAWVTTWNADQPSDCDCRYEARTKWIRDAMRMH